MYNLNYQEFYPTAFIPVGEKDHSLLNNRSALPKETPYWLVALDGHPRNTSDDYYVWNVLVYLADNDGCFNTKEPHYCSESFSSFEQAVDSAKELMKSGKNDEMMKYMLRAKIS